MVCVSDSQQCDARILFFSALPVYDTTGVSRERRQRIPDVEQLWALHINIDDERLNNHHQTTGQSVDDSDV